MSCARCFDICPTAVEAEAGRPAYRIVRFFQNHPSGISRLKMEQRGLTLAQAQAHCHDPETSSRTCKSTDNVARTKVYGPWFDGYEAERT